MTDLDTTQVRDGLQTVFQDVFGDDSIVLEDSMTADDVPGWDSLAHINLIIATEKHFGIRFATAEISGMKGDDQNIGTFLRLIGKKLSAKR
jgi:acyl carrier protein